MTDSRYSSKLGPIPEDHFENDSPHDPELMHKRGGGGVKAFADTMSARIAKLKDDRSGDKPAAKVVNKTDAHRPPRNRL